MGSLDYLLARRLHILIARFMSPDPSELDVLASEPQSWNKYGYVTNAPLRFVDANGQYRSDPWPKRSSFGVRTMPSVPCGTKTSDWIGFGFQQLAENAISGAGEGYVSDIFGHIMAGIIQQQLAFGDYFTDRHGKQSGLIPADPGADQMGNVTTTTYVWVIDTSGRVWVFHYDEDGNQIVDLSPPEGPWLPPTCAPCPGPEEEDDRKFCDDPWCPYFQYQVQD